MWRTLRSSRSPRSPRDAAVGAGVVLGAVALLVAVSSWSAPAPRLGPSLDGPCRVRATVSGTDAVIDPSRSAGVYEVPVAGVVAYDAALTGPAGEVGERAIRGHVELDLPPPVPSLRLARWDVVGRTPAEQGNRAYRLPAAFAPIGATVTVRAEHREAGARCAGSLSVRLAGGPFDNPVRVGTALWTAGAAVLVARAARPPGRPGGEDRRRPPWLDRRLHPDRAGGRRHRWHPHGRPVLGAVAGVLFGAGLATLALLSGAVPLESAVLSAIVVLGPVAGLVVGWTGAGHRRSPSVTAGPGPDREVILLLDEPPGSTSANASGSTASDRAP